MKRQRNIETYLLLFLRKIGMLCKPQRPHKYEIKIKSTCYPPTQVSSIEAEQHVWIQTKLMSRSKCQYNADTRSCVCGAKTIEEFAFNCKKI